jgi:hypothetical protein
MSGGVKALEPEARKLHEVMLRLRYAQVPAVAAVAGMALGGGCRAGRQLRAPRRAPRELHRPGRSGRRPDPGGGRTDLRGAPRGRGIRRAAPDANLLAFLLKYVMAAGTAQVSKSAIEAQAMGWLLPERPYRVQSPRAALRSGARGQGHERCRLSPATQGDVPGGRPRGNCHHHRAAVQHARWRLHLPPTISIWAARSPR